MRRKPILVLLALVIAAGLLVNGCVIPWPSSTKSLYMDATSDGSGGVFVVWENENVAYGQRIDSEGNVRWGDRLVLSTFHCWGSPKAIGDGSGGAIIVWSESEKKDSGYSEPVVYAQRISSDGQILWGQRGKSVPGLCGVSDVVSDGLGGAIMVSPQLPREIQAQRIDHECKPMWSEDGVTVCTTLSGSGGYPSVGVLADGSGGAIVVWVDKRAGGPRNDVYAQRVSAEGEIMWQEDGVPVSVPCYGQITLHIVSDGLGGAIVAWLYRGVSGSTKVHAERLSPDGEPLWEEGGVQVNALPVAEVYPLEMISDGAGGAIIVWQPSLYFEGGLPGLRAQRVNSEGNPQWIEPAALFVDVINSQKESISCHSALIIGDGSGGAIIVGKGQGGIPLPHAQKLSPEGEPLWEKRGVQVTTNPRTKLWGGTKIVSDGSGGVVIVAEAGRRFAYSDRIYAQRMDSQGNPLWTEGGVRVDPVSKISVLAPWIATALVLAGGISWYVLKRRRARS